MGRTRRFGAATPAPLHLGTALSSNWMGDAVDEQAAALLAVKLHLADGCLDAREVGMTVVIQHQPSPVTEHRPPRLNLSDRVGLLVRGVDKEHVDRPIG